MLWILRCNFLVMKIQNPISALRTLALAVKSIQANADIIDYLMQANKILKSKLEAGGKRIKYTPQEKAILARKGRKLSWSKLKEFASIFSPETILRWHNLYVAKKYTAENPNPTKAKATREKIVRIVCEMAKDNTFWGAGRIVGALKHLGIKRSKATVSRIMKDNGFDPQPNGGHKQPVSTWWPFVRTHLHLMASADFFTKEVWTMRGLIRYMVFFVIHNDTKQVKIIHISHSFCGDVMTRLALSMTDYIDGFLKGRKYFFCDKDVLFTNKFKSILENSGVKVRQVSSPINNPYAERFVKSIKYECLNGIVCIGEKMLRTAVNEYVEYYNTERPHQSLDDELVCPDANIYKEHLDLTKKSNTLELLYKSANADELIVKKTRLAGMLNFYYRNTG